MGNTLSLSITHGLSFLSTFQKDVVYRQNPASPRLTLTLAPSLSHGNTSLHVQMGVQIPKLTINSKILSMPLIVANVPTNDYNLSNPVTVVDSSGALVVNYIDSSDGLRRDWYLSRDTIGSVNFTFIAYPRQLLPSTRPGPRSDLREDQGGLIGTGASFIPDIVCFDESRRLEIDVSWNLSQSPPGSHGTWTFDDGSENHVMGSLRTLRKSVFAVGPLRTLHPKVTLGNGHTEIFGIHWFGEAPFDVEALAGSLSPLFAAMASFFNDDRDIYKIFIRRSTVRSFGGTAFTRSFVFEYYDGANISQENIFDLLAHEMVHNWPYLDWCDSDQSCTSYRTWYLEGIAVYYAAILPYRSGIYSKAQFIGFMNKKAQAYYTSPCVNISSQDASDMAWSSFHAQRVPYFRGFIYIVTLSALILAATDGRLSIDDIVLDLLPRKNNHLPYGPQEFLGMIYNILGSDALYEFDDMISGNSLILPPVDSLKGFSLVRRDMSSFELGFDEVSILNRRITGLVPGSRAEEAGLLEGDEVVDSTFFDDSADDVDEEMVVSVKRSGVVLKITYLPRAINTVECYQWVDNCVRGTMRFE
jgi:hypothetical protein